MSGDGFQQAAKYGEKISIKNLIALLKGQLHYFYQVSPAATL